MEGEGGGIGDEPLSFSPQPPLPRHIFLSTPIHPHCPKHLTGYLFRILPSLRSFRYVHVLSSLGLAPASNCSCQYQIQIVDLSGPQCGPCIPHVFPMCLFFSRAALYLLRPKLPLTGPQSGLDRSTVWTCSRFHVLCWEMVCGEWAV